MKQDLFNFKEIDSETTLSDKFQYEFLDVPKPVRPISSNLAEKISAGKGPSTSVAWNLHEDLPDSVENRFGERTIFRYDYCCASASLQPQRALLSGFSFSSARMRSRKRLHKVWSFHSRRGSLILALLR